MCCLCACLVSQKLRWLCCVLTVAIVLCLLALSLFAVCSAGLLKPETKWCCVFSTKDVTCLGDPLYTWQGDSDSVARRYPYGPY